MGTSVIGGALRAAIALAALIAAGFVRSTPSRSTPPASESIIAWAGWPDMDGRITAGSEPRTVGVATPAPDMLSSNAIADDTGMAARVSSR